MEERRSASRVNLAAKATLFVANRQVSCWIADISTRGALLFPIEKVTASQYVRLNVTLPSLSEVLDLDAVVVRETEASGRYAIALQFQGSDPRAETLIRTYVKWAKAQQPGADPGQQSEPAPTRKGTSPAERSVQSSNAPSRASPASPSPAPASQTSRTPSGTRPRVAIATPRAGLGETGPFPALSSADPPASRPKPGDESKPLTDDPVGLADQDEIMNKTGLRDLYQSALDAMKDKNAPTKQSTFRSLFGGKPK